MRKDGRMKNDFVSIFADPYVLIHALFLALCEDGTALTLKGFLSSSNPLFETLHRVKFIGCLNAWQEREQGLVVKKGELPMHKLNFFLKLERNNR